MTSFQLGDARKARANALYEAALSELAGLAPDFLEKFPLETYINELDHHGGLHRYWDVTGKGRELTEGMTAAYPQAAVELYNRALLAKLIATSETRNKHNILESVARFVHEDFDRILTGLERPRPGYYLRSVYLYRRELAIARLKVIPNGAEFIDINVGIPRRDATKDGMRGLRNYAHIFGIDLIRGLAPLYEPHWDRRYIRHFKADSYKDFYRRTADLMIANPEVRGLYGSSWWFDPIVSEISPELAFQRAIPISGGARFAQLHVDNPYLKTEPFAGSPKRKELNEAGKYNPRLFIFFWSRGRLLHWAKNNA